MMTHAVAMAAVYHAASWLVSDCVYGVCGDDL